MDTRIGAKKLPLDSSGLLVLGLISIAFICIGIILSNPGLSRRHWQATNGTVTQIDWGYENHKVIISYQVLGKTYSLLEWSGITAFPPQKGEIVTVRYNPKDPSSAMREPGLYNGSWQSFAAGIAIGIFVLWRCWKDKKCRV